ncbi:hypothetical protein B0H13DRAFT_2473686 [Mycena leptocephala]|nr:hypothetical protein B0H13DRAFT_2473686 [Mycena leptocephala]
MDPEHERLLHNTEANLPSAKHTGRSEPQHPRCSSELGLDSSFGITFRLVLMSGNDSRLPWVVLKLKRFTVAILLSVTIFSLLVAHMAIGYTRMLTREFLTSPNPEKKLFDPCTDHDSVTTIAELTTHYTRSQLFRNGFGSVVCDNNCWDRLGMLPILGFGFTCITMSSNFEENDATRPQVQRHAKKKTACFDEILHIRLQREPTRPWMPAINTSVLFDCWHYGTTPPFFVTVHTELRCWRFAVACPLARYGLRVVPLTLATILGIPGRGEQHRLELGWGSSNLSCNDALQAAENSKAFADAQAHLKLKRAESKGNSSGVFVPLDSGRVRRPNWMLMVPRVAIVNPRLKMKLYEGIERDGISMSAVEYAQNVWIDSENMTLGACQIDTDELGHCVSWMQRPEDRGQSWRGDLL